MPNQVTLDIVSCAADGVTYSVHLVEQGPWAHADVPREVRRVQDRLYSALEVILDGKLAELYPETAGKAVVLRLECWGTPDAPVRDFFERWAQHVQSDNEFAPSIARCPHVSSIGFVYKHGELDGAE
jgi:hypothetical protein